jgi:predicted house-cleaning NTP pyrophosphatase (Maf/HAM1 superfamily)
VNLPKSRAKSCPVCKSREIIPYIGFQLGCQWQCKKCGYTGALIIEKINGDFYNVIGLPLNTLADCLEEFGIYLLGQ